MNVPIRKRKPLGIIVGTAGALLAVGGVTAPLVSHHMTTIAVHHLLHAGMALGAGLLAVMIAPRPAERERAAWVWPAVIVPALGLVFMWPSEYAILMKHPWLHMLDHLSIAVLTIIAVYAAEAYWHGLGWLMLVLVVAMDAAAAGGFGVSHGPSRLLTAQAHAASAPAAIATGRPSSMHAVGAKLYMTMGCNACHTTNGSPGVGPGWKNLANYPQKLANGKTRIADYAFLRTMILDPGKIDLAGFPAGVMPGTYKEALSGARHPHETDLNAIIWYINTLSDRSGKTSEPPVPDRVSP